MDCVKIECCLFSENIFLPENWFSIARKKRVYIRIGMDSICLTGTVPFYGQNTKKHIDKCMYKRYIEGWGPWLDGILKRMSC